MSTEAQDRDIRLVATVADIKNILVTKAGVEADALAGNEHRSFDDLGLDSLAVLSLSGAVAEIYGVQIPEDPSMSVLAMVHEINELIGNEA